MGRNRRPGRCRGAVRYGQFGRRRVASERRLSRGGGARRKEWSGGGRRCDHDGRRQPVGRHSGRDGRESRTGHGCRPHLSLSGGKPQAGSRSGPTKVKAPVRVRKRPDLIRRRGGVVNAPTPQTRKPAGPQSGRIVKASVTVTWRCIRVGPRRRVCQAWIAMRSRSTP